MEVKFKSCGSKIKIYNRINLELKFETKKKKKKIENITGGEREREMIIDNGDSRDT